MVKQVCVHIVDGKGTVFDMSDLANHIAMTISINFNDIDSEYLPLSSSFFDDEEEQIPGIKQVGCYAVPESTDVYEDTFEMMEELGLHTDCDSLNDDIDHLFEDKTWIKKILSNYGGIRRKNCNGNVFLTWSSIQDVLRF